MRLKDINKLFEIEQKASKMYLSLRDYKHSFNEEFEVFKQKKFMMKQSLKEEAMHWNLVSLRAEKWLLGIPKDENVTEIKETLVYNNPLSKK